MSDINLINNGPFGQSVGSCGAILSASNKHIICILHKGHSGNHIHEYCKVVRENGRDPSRRCLLHDGHGGEHKFPNDESYNHYVKDVSKLYKIDVYRVLELFEVRSPAIQHAIKKLLVAGGRGAKDTKKDIVEAIVSLKRWEEMQGEDEKISVEVSER